MGVIKDCVMGCNCLCILVCIFLCSSVMLTVDHLWRHFSISKYSDYSHTFDDRKCLFWDDTMSIYEKADWRWDVEKDGMTILMSTEDALCCERDFKLIYTRNSTNTAVNEYALLFAYKKSDFSSGEEMFQSCISNNSQLIDAFNYGSTADNQSMDPSIADEYNPLLYNLTMEYNSRPLTLESISFHTDNRSKYNVWLSFGSAGFCEFLFETLVTLYIGIQIYIVVVLVLQLDTVRRYRAIELRRRRISEEAAEDDDDDIDDTGMGVELSEEMKTADAAERDVVDGDDEREEELGVILDEAKGTASAALEEPQLILPYIGWFPLYVSIGGLSVLQLGLMGYMLPFLYLTSINRSYVAPHSNLFLGHLNIVGFEILQWLALILIFVVIIPLSLIRAALKRFYFRNYDSNRDLLFFWESQSGTFHNLIFWISIVGLSIAMLFVGCATFIHSGTPNLANDELSLPWFILILITPPILQMSAVFIVSSASRDIDAGHELDSFHLCAGYFRFRESHFEIEFESELGFEPRHRGSTLTSPDDAGRGHFKTQSMQAVL